MTVRARSLEHFSPRAGRDFATQSRGARRCPSPLVSSRYLPQIVVHSLKLSHDASGRLFVVRDVGHRDFLANLSEGLTLHDGVENAIPHWTIAPARSRRPCTPPARLRPLPRYASGSCLLLRVSDHPQILRGNTQRFINDR